MTPIFHMVHKINNGQQYNRTSKS